MQSEVNGLGLEVNKTSKHSVQDTECKYCEGRTGNLCRSVLSPDSTNERPSSAGSHVSACIV